MNPLGGPELFIRYAKLLYQARPVRVEMELNEVAVIRGMFHEPVAIAEKAHGTRATCNTTRAAVRVE
jgi:hypothetical protein